MSPFIAELTTGFGLGRVIGLLSSEERHIVHVIRGRPGPHSRPRQQAALWPKAKAGDVEAVMTLLRIMHAYCILLGQFPSRGKDPKAGWPSCVGPATVVIHPDDCRHLGCEEHRSFGRP